MADWTDSSLKFKFNSDDKDYLAILTIYFIIFMGILLVFQYSLSLLNIHPAFIFILSLGIIFGNDINLFLFKLKDEPEIYYQRYYVFPWFEPITRRFVKQGFDTDVFINLTGAVIPLIVVLLFAIQNPQIIIPAIFLIIPLVLVINRIAVVSRFGVLMPFFILPMLGALSGVLVTYFYFLADLEIVVPEIAMISYVAITVGTLIGADLLNLGKFKKIRSNGLSIGGAGIFDGIFLSGLLTLILLL